MLLLLFVTTAQANSMQYPQGYYPFEESPARIPPVVRKPPYLQTQVKCPGVGGGSDEQTLDNLCGDLNKGYLPVNPIGQNILGVSYPFELLKNKTLDFFSRTLPILKADDTLPKVARFQDSHILYNPTIFNSQPNTKIKFFDDRSKRHTQEEEDSREEELDAKTLPAEVTEDEAASNKEKEVRREKREASPAMEAKPEDARPPKEPELNQRDGRSGPIPPLAPARDGRSTGSSSSSAPSAREGRGWCDDSFGVFCMLFNAIKGGGSADNRIGKDPDAPDSSGLNSVDQPMTPCPSAVEYVTPVFAKNYQGVWRYVVQIPYEGYFTQTVEVVKCLSTKCEFLEGSCLASPRWVSLLVAEIYYPDTYFPSGEQPIPGRNPVRGNPPTDFNGHLLKKAGKPESSSSGKNCDGYDELGCFHVRLYYDWFLIPGSCKCWKNDFFAQYTRKK